MNSLYNSHCEPLPKFCMLGGSLSTDYSCCVYQVDRCASLMIRHDVHRLHSILLVSVSSIFDILSAAPSAESTATQHQNVKTLNFCWLASLILPCMGWAVGKLFVEQTKLKSPMIWVPSHCHWIHQKGNPLLLEFSMLIQGAACPETKRLSPCWDWARA